MKKKLLFATIIVAFSSCNSLEKTMENKQKINKTLDSWHDAAGNAKFDAYFDLMTETGVFIGTDATENWQNEAFRNFSKPYFDKGKAWNFNSLQRSIYLSKDQKTAWFDELLDTQMKICRGSGVLIKESGKWKILPQEEDWETNEKARSAKIFYSYWKIAREDEEYLLQKERFIRLKSE